jgi:hypothetical protein
VRYAFRILCTFLAEVALDLDKQAVVHDIVVKAEKLNLGPNDYAVFDVPERDLKAVVRFERRTINFMTCEEYEKSGLPTGHPDGSQTP